MKAALGHTLPTPNYPHIFILPSVVKEFDLRFLFEILNEGAVTSTD